MKEAWLLFCWPPQLGCYIEGGRQLFLNAKLACDGKDLQTIQSKIPFLGPSQALEAFQTDKTIV